MTGQAVMNKWWRVKITSREEYSNLNKLKIKIVLSRLNVLWLFYINKSERRITFVWTKYEYRVQIKRIYFIKE